MQRTEPEFVWIKDEDSGASLQREIIRIPKETIERAISKEVMNRLESLERQLDILKADRELFVSNSQAKEILTKTLEDFKAAGIKSIDIIDLSNKTKLPPSQINEVMIQLEEDGKVSEYGQSN